jgi:hypothetical protein
MGEPEQSVPGIVADEFGYIAIKFQNGPVKEVGVNGTQIGNVIEILVRRLEGFQDGAFPCRENAIAITKLQEAAMWLEFRTRKRMQQGVEGLNAAHK